jgi:hypothetical protein
MGVKVDGALRELDCASGPLAPNTDERADRLPRRAPAVGNPEHDSRLGRHYALKRTPTGRTLHGDNCSRCERPGITNMTPRIHCCE